MMKITKVYTKSGDKGTTSLVGGIRINKADIRLEAYGTVDELNSQMGLLAAYMADGPDKDMVERIQSNLFVVGTHLATDQSCTPLYDSAKLNEGETELLEKEIDRIMDFLPEAQGFVLPGAVRLPLSGMCAVRFAAGPNGVWWHCQRMPSYLLKYRGISTDCQTICSF